MDKEGNTMQKSNKLKIGSLLSYIQMFLGAFISIIYTPLMLDLLGQSEYGLYNTVSSTIAMLSLLSLGFNSGYIRFFSKYKKNNDFESIWKLNGLFLIIFSIIGMIALVCGMYLSNNLNIVFASGLTFAEYQTARKLMILLSVNMAVSFPMSVFTNIISANEEFIFLKTIGVLKTVISPLITVPLLLMGYKSIAMVVVTMAVAIICDTIYVYYVLKKLRYKFIFHNFERGLFRTLFGYTFFIALNMIVDQINWSVDKILLGRFHGTMSVAIYSVGYALFQYYMMFSSAISSVFTPKIHRIIDETRHETIAQRQKLTELFTKVGRIQFIILMLVGTGILFFGKDFVTKYWAGVEYHDSYYVTIILSFAATIALIQNVGIEIQRALNLHQFRSFVYAIMAFINLIISIFLCQKYGAIGSAIGTGLSLIIANGLIMNIYYHKKCNVNIIYFWKNIMKLSKGLILPLVFGVLCSISISTLNIWHYLFCIIAYTGIYCLSMWMFGMEEYEKQLILNPLKRMILIFKK